MHILGGEKVVRKIHMTPDKSPMTSILALALKLRSLAKTF